MGSESYIGIDFGTTNTSVVQILNDEHGQRIKILGDSGGKYPFPSIVAFDKDYKAQFGADVKKNREVLENSCKVISSFKSILGSEDVISVFQKRYKAKDILVEYLRWLRAYIKHQHNIEINKAAFSFPVSFSRAARSDLMYAAKKVGIEVTNLISESTAAYLANRDATKGMQRVMVVDWGGGTLDLSILKITGNRIEEIAVDGERIGGNDIDRELAQRVHAMINRKQEDKSVVCQFDEMSPEQRDKLINNCEKAKIQMSEDDSDYPLTIRDYGKYGTKTIRITVEMFEDILKPIIERSTYKVIQRTLNKAELSAGSIDAVIVAGGSSSLRLFGRVLANHFGEEKLIRPENYQFVSSYGAALTNLIGGKFKLNDSVSVKLSDNTIYPLLEKNKDGVNSARKQFVFSLIEDAPNAHFIFTNGDGRIIYEKVNVPTKGFLREHLMVSAEIGFDQIAKIHIQSDSTANVYSKEVEIGGLTYFYEL